MNAPIQQHAPAHNPSTPSASVSFFQGIGITLLFGVAILFSHYDTKSQIKDQSFAIEEVTRTYVNKQQEAFYDRVQRDVQQLMGKTIDEWRNESAKTNILLQRILDEQPHIASSNGNTATSTSSVVNTPSTSLQAP